MPRSTENDPQPPPPTLEQFHAYQRAWAYFNVELFGGELKPCLLNFSRHRAALGFFVADKWKRGEEKIHEISLNPDLLNEPPQESMGTLVHEMCHQWQQDHGTPPRKCYHDAEWAAKMEQVGLIPSHDARPGGNKTGQKMTQYVEPGGRYEAAFARMPPDFILPWTSGGGEKEEKPKPVKKAKLRCPECEVDVWILVTLIDHEVVCGECGERFLTKDRLKEWKDDREVD